VLGKEGSSRRRRRGLEKQEQKAGERVYIGLAASFGKAATEADGATNG
jgi:hypothetical protein